MPVEVISVGTNEENNFNMRKKLISNFENFVGNRQTKFHEFKFRVCVNTF